MTKRATENASAAAQANMEGLSKVQKELGDTFAEANEHWLARAKSEADLTSDLMAKLGAARSIPDAAAVYQEWMGQRMQRFAEDGQKLAADAQKVMRAWTNLFARGGMNGSS